MKNPRHGLQAFFLFSACTLTQGQTLYTGLVGYWNFDEGTGSAVADLSGQGNNGTLFNGGSAWVAGHFGTALSFPGVAGAGSTRVEIPNAASLQISNAVSFAAWVRVDDINRDAPILAKEGPGGLLAYWFGTLGLNVESAVPGNFGMLLDVDGNQGWSVYDRNQGSLVQGTWAHIASTWDGSQISHYLNGTLVAGGAAFAGTVHASTAFLAIGANSNYNSTAFLGLVDDLYLYNRALSVGEVGQLMAAPIPEPSAYGLFAGLGALGLAAVLRRRTRQSSRRD